MSHKGQFKIQQTSFMLIAVAIFVVMIFLFYVSLKYRDLQRTATNLEEDKSVFLAEYLSGSQEFSCAGKQYCIDTDKIMSLKNITSYQDLWNLDYIKIRKLYPSADSETECTLSAYPDCNLYTVFKAKKQAGNSSVGSFVALCRYEREGGYAKQVCELGRITIGYQIK